MAARARGRRQGGGAGIIVVRRVEEGARPRHGGAWKVAYADFVTAMMAFFLLMWLLNATTEEQRKGLADYFSPANLLGRTVSGSGQPFGGRTPNDAGDMTSTSGAVRVEPGRVQLVTDVEEDESETPARPAPPRDGPPGEEEIDPRSAERVAAHAAAVLPPAAPPAAGGRMPLLPPRDAADRPPGPQGIEAAPGPRETLRPAVPEGGADAERLADAALRAELARREAAEFARAEAQLRAAVRDDPGLADLARQLLVEQTPEGMRIQILDAERQPMFALGGSAPNERARVLLARVGQVIARLPNPVSIAGHTDATPFRGGGERSNWDLSAERANATRRLLVESGVAEARIRGVAGHAERDPLLPDEPTAPANRRVAVTLLRLAPPAAEADAAIPAAPAASSPR